MSPGASYQKVRAGIFVAAMLLVALLAFSASGVVKMVLIASLLAYIMDPIVTSLESRGMSRSSATLLFFVVVSSLLTILSILFIPLLIDQTLALRVGLASPRTTHALAAFEQWVRDRLGFVGLESFDLTERLHAVKIYLSDALVNFLITDVPSLVLHAVAIPFIIFFLLKDGRELKKQLISVVPNRYFEFSLNLVYKMDVQLGNYLRSQFFDALIFGVLSTITLWALGVDYFLVIGLFAGMANLIPFVGPIAGALPAITIALLNSGDAMKAVQVALAFVLLKMVDDMVVQPMVVARNVHLHPLAVLLAIIIGGQVFGVLGMLLAVPCTGFLKVLLQESIITLRKYRFT